MPCYLGLAERVFEATSDALQVRCLFRVVIGCEKLRITALRREIPVTQQTMFYTVQSIFHTCYLRGIFPESCFKEVPMAGLDGEYPEGPSM